jgi:excisionase family DNA binding protein
MGGEPVIRTKAGDVVGGSKVEPICFDIPGACAASGLGRSTLYTAIKNRELATLKVRKRRLIEVDELRRWLASKRQQAA